MNKITLKKSKDLDKKRSLIFWGSLIALSLACILMKTVPDALKNIKQRNEIQEFEKRKIEIDNKINELEATLANKKSEFQIIASKSLKQEEKLLPKTLEIETISKSLEIYSLLNNSFNLSSLSFGQIKQDKDMNTSVLPVNMKFSSTEKEARQFIKYLQSNKLPLELSSQAEIALKRFIENNPVPLTTIQTIDFSTQTDESSKLKELKEVTLNVNFYGKPLPEEKSDKK